MVAHHHLPPLFHLPLLLAWLVSVGPPNSTERNKTSSKTERYPDFALENMSKSCLAAESISHDRVPCESGAAAAHGPPRVGCHPQSRCCQPWGLWSHHAACAEAPPGSARVLVAFTAAGAPGEATSRPPPTSPPPRPPPPLEALPHRSARETERRAHKLATRRHGSATLSAVHRNSLTHTRRELSPPPPPHHLCRLSLSLSLSRSLLLPPPLMLMLPRSCC